MAVIHRREVVSKQIKKAVEQRYQGLNIYAYYNMNTKQVVYSLTRIMKSGQIMPQLVNHGKKTVPAALRRDIWRPYFSIQFPDNDGGRKAGLKAYQRLREFALRRQLDPPEDYLMTTQEDVDRAARRYGTPSKLRLAYQNQSGKVGKRFQLPLLGQKLPQQLRAAKLMDQRATSVADTSFILSLALEQLQQLYQQRFSSARALLLTTQNHLASLGHRGRRRLRNIRREEAEKALEIAKRQQLAETVSQEKGQLPLDKHIAQQLSTQFGGMVVGDSNRVEGIAPTSDNNYKNACEIQVNWADLRDGTYAESWPQGVFHGQLQPRALVKNVVSVSQKGYTAEDGVEVSTQWQKKKETSRTGSVHVHGDDAADIAMIEAQIQAEKEAAARHQTLQQTITFYQDYLDAKKNALRVEQLHRMYTKGEPLTEADMKAAKQKGIVSAELKKLTRESEKIEERHPQEAAEAKELAEFRQILKALRAEQTESTEFELRQAEQINPTRVASAKEFVAKYTVAEFGQERQPEELDVVREYLERPAEPLVIPEEKPGMLGKMKSWFGR